MTELGLRPRSATELVDAAFQVFRRDPVSFIVAAAVFYVPWLLVRLALSLDVPTVNGQLDWSLLMVSAVLGVFVYATASAVVMLIARNVYLDRPTDLAGAFREIVPKIPAVIMTSVITYTLTVLAAMLFFFPALYVVARFFAVRQIVVIEKAGVGRALSRSSELSVNVKWHVLGTLILAGIVTLAVSFGVVMLSTLIPSRVLLFALSTAASIIVYPFLAIAQTLLYYDIRIRKEGFDIEYLAGSAPPPLDTAASG
jgi:hypothetical protein